MLLYRSTISILTSQRCGGVIDSRPGLVQLHDGTSVVVRINPWSSSVVARSQTIFFCKNSVHSFSPHELEISFATRPSRSTVGETWMLFCLLYLTDEPNGSLEIRCASKPRVRRTGVLQIVRHVDTAVWAGLVRQEIEDRVALVGADHARREVSELATDLLRRERRRRDVEVLVLFLEELRGFL